MIAPVRKLILVTGPSGAGMSTATNALEDVGFETIDNLPLRMVVPLLDHPASGRPMSLGLDLRNRDFSARGLLDLMDTLEIRNDVSVELMFLDCHPDEIHRRYSSTRRRHPVPDAPSLADGITQEIEKLAALKGRADILIDTTYLNPHQLRAEVEKWCAPQGQAQIIVQVQSFSYKRGLPRSADMVFDCRFLRNPHWEKTLRAMDGRCDPVQEYVTQDPRYSEFFKMAKDLVTFVLPQAKVEGKSYLTVAFGCSGGKHRSVTLAEKMASDLEELTWHVSLRHRELDRLKTESARP
ncbi:MAG: RNase adapter RapZ [Paracoccaceae bacterium]